MASTELIEFDYTCLGVEKRREMIQQAILQLERMLFENDINITINSEDFVMTHEDGSTQTLLEQKAQLEGQIYKIRQKHHGLL